MKQSALNPLVFVPAWIDKTAMYLLVLSMLGLLVACSLVLSLFSLVAPSFMSQCGSLVVVVVTGLVSSIAMAKIRGIDANHFSSLITALIIFFLIIPATTLPEYGVLSATVVIAILSKYILVYRKQHIFNAATVAVFILYISGYGVALWWVATPWLFVPVLVTGLIVAAKIRQLPMVGVFILVSFLVFIFEEIRFGSNVLVTWSDFFVSFPVLFLAFYMLTEPFSMPPTKQTRFLYAVVVGVLFSSSIFKVTPEVALLIGNLIAYPFTLRRKVFLSFKSLSEVARNTFELIFDKPVGFNFKAGQYLEWMVTHPRPDNRGTRRYFTIASSPTEPIVRLALKIPEVSSTYKQALKNLKEGSVVTVSQLAGDFVLPKNAKQKIALVAGGIGVTPFRSHLQHIADTNDTRDMVLFYANNTLNEVAYAEFLTLITKKIALKTVYIFAKEPQTTEYESGYFSSDVVTKHLTDYKERHWYISGSPPMVRSAEAQLRTLGVKRSHITKDFFPGLA